MLSTRMIFNRKIQVGEKYGKNYAMLTLIKIDLEWLYYSKTKSISAKNITKDKGGYSIMIEMSTNKKDIT